MRKDSRIVKLVAMVLVATIFASSVIIGDLFSQNLMAAKTYRTPEEVQSMLDEKMTQTGFRPGGAVDPHDSSIRGSGCWEFVFKLSTYVFGHGIPGQRDNDYQLVNSSNFTQIGESLTVAAGDLTEENLAELLSQAMPGDVIQMDYTYKGSNSLHVMMVYSVSEEGIVLYHAGSEKVFFGASSGSDPLYGKSGKTLSWSDFISYLGGSDDGISLYRSKYLQFETTVEAFTYTIENEQVTITGYDASIGGTDVIIPSKIEGYPVTVIGEQAFYENTVINYVYIPKGVTTIEYRAFYGSSLAKIHIPYGVTYIGQAAFHECRDLVTINIPSTVTYIGPGCFGYCTNLKTIDLPEGLTEICDATFLGCSKLETIDIPSTVTSIGGRAFNACSILSNITIPQGVTFIGDNAFMWARAMTEINLPNSVTTLDDFALADLSDNITEIVIPDSVTSIGQGLFNYCRYLTSITLSNNITVIPYRTFDHCSRLPEIIIPYGVTIIEEGAFQYCDQLTNVYIPETVATIEEDAFINCPNVVICCKPLSPAHVYAVFHNIDYELYEDLPTPTPSTTTTPVPTQVPSTTTPTSTPSPTATATPAPNQGNSTIPPATGNTVNRSAAESFATRCYELVLDRTPDATGLNNWTNSLVNNQNTGANMAYGFFFSPEYLNSNTSNEEFVTTLYNVFLDRAPDQSGLNDWVGQLEAGATREQIFAGVANSNEFFDLCNGYGITAGHYVQGLDNTQQQNINAFVARLYSMCLGRNGDYAGQESWVRQLINRQNSGAGVGYGFFFSPEFINRNLTNEEYVATLYRVFLGREPDQAGFNSWVSQLDNGADRLSIFRGFAHSQEYTNICNSYGIERGTI